MSLKKILLLAVLLLQSTSLFAQADNRENLIFGYFSGLTESELEIPDSDSDKEKDTIRAYYVGYQRISYRKIGFSGGFTFSNFFRDGDTLTNLMLEGNATYGITEKLHGFGGLNASQFTSENSDVEGIFDNLGIGFGAQVGFEYQVFSFMAINLRYLATRHEYEAGVGRIKLNTHGARLGIVGLFY